MKPLLWKTLSARARADALRRPAQTAQPQIAATVTAIIAEVRRNGDAALRSLTEKFDGVKLRSPRVTPAEFAFAEKSLSTADRSALRRAYANIRTFHAAQKPAALRVETMPGIVCEKVSRPIGRVGLYVPGGSATLPSTALMLGVPSQLAANPVRVLCTPPAKDGTVNAWILFAAKLCGVTEIYKVGGAQAIAAMAYGTTTIPKCDKLFGPGNAFVTEAKLQVSRNADGAAFDLPAGPSEVLVIADDRATPAFVAADLLSQAEHGADSQVILVTLSAKFAALVSAELEKQLADLPRAATARKALERSRCFVATHLAEAVTIANAYAPEHLILQVANPRALLADITTAGSVFLGDWTPESLGDYASGTNHVLPTYGWARVCSGLGLVDFQRTMTVQTAARSGLKKLGPVVERLALAEGLAAHQRAVRVRLDSLNG
ncbi:histidinol dehydrogenase [Oleiharenicola lentus]|uniref:histidinol dehydrogenase n=1 Tax=Oleiharenicola lentus TaxID=2508720 RepID=UPI003F67B0D8